MQLPLVTFQVLFHDEAQINCYAFPGDGYLETSILNWGDQI